MVNSRSLRRSIKGRHQFLKIGNNQFGILKVAEINTTNQARCRREIKQDSSQRHNHCVWVDREKNAGVRMSNNIEVDKSGSMPGLSVQEKWVWHKSHLILERATTSSRFWSTGQHHNVGRRRSMQRHH